MPDFMKAVGATPTQIWGHGNRSLTELTGQPRADLMGEDATFEAGVGARKEHIDRLAGMETFDDPIEGILVADGLEQNIVVDEFVGDSMRHLEGYVDFSNLGAEDTVVIKYYVSLSTPVSYRKYFEGEYSGAQPLPVLFIATKPGRYGIKATLQQTAGSPKSFAFQFFRRRIP